MLNVAVFIFLALTSLIPNGIQSQSTIEDDGCEDWRLNQVEAEMRQRSSEAVWRASVERLERELKVFQQRNVVIKLAKRLNQTSSITENRNVNGVTKHEDRIYVLCRNPNSIRVFEDMNPFNLVTDIQLTQIGEPRDIVYNNRSKCFYVTDLRNTCIWKITITDGIQARATKWLLSTTYPYTVSLSRDGHLLVLDGGFSLSSRLAIYNGSDARLIRSLGLNLDIKMPLHAIQNQTGEEFLIIHRLRDYWNGPWVISRVTGDGQKIIAQSNPRNESETGEPHYYLSLDSNYDRLFVADFSNNRVFLFESVSLEFLQILLPRERDEIYEPKRIYYDKEKKQLIVGQYSSIDRNNRGGVVDVYTIN